MGLPELRFETAGQRLVGQQGVEIDGRFGNADMLDFGGNSAVKIGQRRAIIEPAGIGHEALDKVQYAVRPIDEGLNQLVWVDTRRRLALVEPAFGTGRILRRRHPQQGEVVAALEVRSLFAKLLTTFHVDQGRNGIGEIAVRVSLCGDTLRFDEHGPSRAQSPQGIIEA